MKLQTGVIKDYNGLSGKIITDSAQYLLLLQEIIEEEDLKNGDEVEFIPEEVQNIKIARFVKKLTN